MKRKPAFRKETRAFYLCVEGECEKRYFLHLKKLINQSDCLHFFDPVIRIEKSPKAFVRTCPSGTSFVIWDREGNSTANNSEFEKKMNEIVKLKKDKWDISPGYTHLSFELWLLLHKVPMLSPCDYNDRYLPLINRHYSCKFETLSDYKQEQNFNQLLQKISLEEVAQAVQRGDEIRNHNQRFSTKRQYGKWVTYDENPDILLHECVKKILLTCVPKYLKSSP